MENTHTHTHNVHAHTPHTHTLYMQTYAAHTPHTHHTLTFLMVGVQEEWGKRPVMHHRPWG